MTRYNRVDYMPGCGPYPAWKHTALISISNPASVANYQHRLNLVWLPGMRSDFRDVRFAQTTGVKCSYWIESYISRSSAVVWIKVPAANQRSLRLFYGNGQTVSESDGDAVFDFFDDFNGGSLDGDKWAALSGTPSVSNGELVLFTPDAGSEIITCKTEFGFNYLHEWKIKFGSANVLHNIGAFKSGLYFCFSGSSNSSGRAYSGTNEYTATLIDSIPTTYEIWGVARTDGSTASFYQGRDNIGSLSSVQVPDGTIGSGIGVWANGKTIYADWAIVRKFAAIEPTLTFVSHRPHGISILPTETDYILPDITFSADYTPSVLGNLSPAVIPFSSDYTPSVLSKLFIALNQLDITQFSVSKSVSDDIWVMNATIDGYQVINLDPLRHVTYSVTDHLGVSQDIFAGILPKSSLTIKETANRTSITGYDYSWYLARQTVPAAYQHNTAGTNPATVMTGLLGGDDWEETTGIMPYAINSVTAWGDTLNSRVFDFPTGTTKKQAIDKICNYCRFVFMVKWIVVDGIATPAAYFVSEDDIDTDLDLPAAVTFAYPDPYLVGDIKPVAKGDERYNRVTVIGRNNTGGVFTKTVESPSVTNGDELAVEKIENSGSWTTQDQVDARAAELYSYYSATAYTYTAKLLDRMDLELLQQMRITGYTGVSENWMRITRIKKTVRATKDGVEKLVEIEFTENVKWSALRRMYRYSSDDMTNEIETIVDGKINQMPGLQVGVCTAIDGQEGMVTLESGETITTRVV